MPICGAIPIGYLIDNTKKVGNLVTAVVYVFPWKADDDNRYVEEIIHSCANGPPDVLYFLLPARREKK